MNGPKWTNEIIGDCAIIGERVPRWKLNSSDSNNLSEQFSCNSNTNDRRGMNNTL